MQWMLSGLRMVVTHDLKYEFTQKDGKMLACENRDRAITSSVFLESSLHI